MSHLLDINIPYWFSKQLNIILWVNSNGKVNILSLVFWLNYRVKDIQGYEEDWFLGERKSFALWKWNVKK